MKNVSLKNVTRLGVSSLFLLTAAGFLTVSAGCDSAVNAAKGMQRRLQKKFDNKTILLQMEGKLSDAEKAREQLKEMVKNLYDRSEAKQLQIKRLEAEKEGIIKEFTELQDFAKNAGLPKSADATEEDKAKTFQIGTKSYSGEAIYRVLGKYKDELNEKTGEIESAQEWSKSKKVLADEIQSQMPFLNKKIEELQARIEEYKIQQNLYLASRSIDIPVSQMSSLLNADETANKMQEEIDVYVVQWKKKVEAAEDATMMNDLKRPAIPVTDDDLI